MQSMNLDQLSVRDMDALEALINDWIGESRWFISDRKNPQARILHSYPLTMDASSCTILLIVRSANTDYFVPVTLNITDPNLLSNLAQYPQAVLGYLDLNGRNLMVTDACEHPDGQIALLQACFGQLAVPSLSGTALRGELKDLPPFASVAKLRSEQSNTSIIYKFTTPDSANSAGIILKLFRIVQPGTNPDVELLGALDKTGIGVVPKQYGHAQIARSSTDANLTADVLVAQEFLTDAKDAWQVFQAELAKSTSILENLDPIFSLGTITADIHHHLASIFPTAKIDAAAKIATREKWSAQTALAIAAAPKLAQYEQQISAIFDAAIAVDWPDAQRIHGDYHLGQVLDVPDRGWIALDFEGEPLKPLPERTQLSLALRDVAGMLRSFSYAAGAAELNGKPSSATHAWAEAATMQFLAGYGQLSTAEATLLTALVLDKSLYEVVYEATYRPRWLQIPIQGIAQIIG
ncbi:hypothetical protein [Arcanobacterium hippocoleae]|uniref:1,4-alpha-glucan branching enzyme n=1 Tax=Arcanobacterium hippocoleae TaxID=149017 RepID=A0ABU1T3N0_9ACTO|nr:hypothetical protein [Arcanobacterium hippocoleae]MDR6939996.1 1,4-alpha-glucan branching enzyme [Arcanobacterium hippocoleae]